MIEQMNPCTGDIEEGKCGGQDFSISTSSKGDDIEVEIKCNICGDVQTYKKPRLEFIKPILIDEHNSRHPVVE